MFILTMVHLAKEKFNSSPICAIGPSRKAHLCMYVCSGLQLGKPQDLGDAMVQIRPNERISLSNRQFIVLALLLDGLSEQEMADRLGVTSHAIQGHLKNICRTLGVTTRFELVALFTRNDRDRLVG
jgi:DNA-binding CsgD family transcriptional regulator